MLIGAIRRWLGGTGLGVGGAAMAVAASAQPAPHIPAASAPAAWIAYAGQVNDQLQVWLADGSQPAKRLGAYLAGLTPSGSDQVATIPVKVWIDADGTVSKVDFPPFADVQANADLTALIQGRRVPAAPPPGLLLPIRLNLKIAPAPAPAPESASAA
jgi:hypothetical protein